MSVTVPARDAFKLAVALTTGAARRQISMSEMLIATSTLAQRHMDELIEILNEEK